MTTLARTADYAHQIAEDTDDFADDCCPLVSYDELKGRPVPALPVHCVLESIKKHGFELTRRHILQACGLMYYIHRSDVLSISLLRKAMEKIEGKLARAAPSKRITIQAKPFPFIDFRVPHDRHYHERLEEWRMERKEHKHIHSPAKHTSSSSDCSLSSTECEASLESNTLLLAIAPGHQVSCFNQHENDTSDETDADEELTEEQAEDSGEDSDDEAEDEDDLSEGELETEEDAEEEEEEVEVA